MAMTYEMLLEEARHIPPEEQRRLRDALKMAEQEQTGQPSQNVRERAREAIARLDELAARIGAAWQDDMSATEAVKEQRREL